VKIISGQLLSSNKHSIFSPISTTNSRSWTHAVYVYTYN